MTTSIKKMNLYFTYKSCVSLKSFMLSITVKTITNSTESGTVKKKLKNLAIVVLRSSDNAEFSHCCFAEDWKKMYKDL